MNQSDRKEFALSFIQGIKEADPEEVERLIDGEAGPELAEFFFSYSANLLASQPTRLLPNASSLFLMGYLLGKAEMRETEEPVTLN
jgi:hypothetical protein